MLSDSYSEDAILNLEFSISCIMTKVLVLYIMYLILNDIQRFNKLKPVTTVKREYAGRPMFSHLFGINRFSLGLGNIRIIL